MLSEGCKTNSLIVYVFFLSSPPSLSLSLYPYFVYWEERDITPHCFATPSQILGGGGASGRKQTKLLLAEREREREAEGRQSRPSLCILVALRHRVAGKLGFAIHKTY